MESTDQERKLILSKAIDKMITTIGSSGTIKVVESYLSELEKVEKSIDNIFICENLDEIKKIGHRYKSTSQLVGALALADIFVKFENVESVENVMHLKNEIKPELVAIKIKLNECLAYLQ